MGEVLLALDPNAAGLEQFVALKCLHRHMQDDSRLVDMFYREAGIGKMLRHRNLVRIDDARMMAGRHTMVMDFAPGITVRGILDRLAASGDTIPLQHALCIVRQAARGLGYAHRLVGADGKAMGLVHRDVSPDNIQVGFDGVVRVIDFGVAAAAMREQGEDEGLAGKIAYMSPEQARGEALDRRSDIFSLGTVLWELLRNECPYPRDNRALALHSVATDTIAAPLSPDDELHVAINEAWGQMHTLERRDRVTDARALSEELRALELTVRRESDENLARWMQSLFRTEFEELRTICEKVLHAPRPNASTVDLSAQLAVEDPATFAEGEQQPTTRRLQVGDAPRRKEEEVSDGRLMLPTGEITTIDEVTRWRKQRSLFIALSVALLLFCVAGGTAWYLSESSGTSEAAPTVLRIDTTPDDATILLNGQELEGTTPAIVAGQLGESVELELRLRGYRSVNDSVVVTEALVRDGLSYELLPDPASPYAPIGEVRVSYSPADAVLWIDGTIVSEASPAIKTGLRLNTPHVMRLEREGYETLFMDVVLTNEEALEFDLQMNEGVQLARLTVTSEPPGAEVEVNGQPVGQTPLVSFELPANTTYTITVDERGYRTWRRGVILNNGDEAVHADLRRIPSRSDGAGRNSNVNNNANSPNAPRISNVNDAPNLNRDGEGELPYRLLE